MKEMNWIIAGIAGIATTILLVVVVFVSLYNSNNNIIYSQVQRHEESVGVKVDDVFYDAIATEKEAVPIIGEVRGGIVPHHDLVSKIIDDFFFQLAQQQTPKTFIILGPNHTDVGLAPAISGQVVWQTPFGDVHQNYKLLDQLVAEGVITYDEENYTVEHSIAVLTPFIKRYFPDAQVAPIILNSKQTSTDAILLAEHIAGLVDENTFVLASVDFSHYLSESLAREKDSITYDAILSRDYEQISAMDSDYLDSPLSVVAFLETMSLLSSEYIHLLAHTNSAEFLNKEIKETTSYYSLFFKNVANPSPITTISMGGDVMLSRVVNEKIKEHKDRFWPFERVKHFFSSADIAIVNLESPFKLAADYHVPVDSFSFKTNPENIVGLVDSGVDLVTLANNHFGDQGVSGMNDTFKILKQNNISYIGGGKDFTQAHQGEIVQVNGTKYGFLSYAYSEWLAATASSPGIASMDVGQAQKDVLRIEQEADVVIVIMHAGEEYTDHPNEQQKSFAHAVIDVGADLVVGHHPHWVQTVETYKGAPIVYSLGNLVFDQMWSEETQQGVIATAHFQNSKLIKIEFTPIHIYDFGQPRIIESAEEAKDILEKMKIDSFEYIVSAID